MQNHYWDLDECRWVHYVHGDVEETAGEVAPVPGQRTDERALDVVAGAAVAASTP